MPLPGHRDSLRHHKSPSTPSSFLRARRSGAPRRPQPPPDWTKGVKDLASWPRALSNGEAPSPRRAYHDDNLGPRLTLTRAMKNLSRGVSPRLATTRLRLPKKNDAAPNQCAKFAWCLTALAAGGGAASVGGGEEHETIPPQPFCQSRPGIKAISRWMARRSSRRVRRSS